MITTDNNPKIECLDNITSQQSFKFHLYLESLNALTKQRSKVKVGVLSPVQQPGSYWDRSSELPLVGLEPTEVTAYD